MSYLVIKAPKLTDEAAVNIQDFFYALIDAFGEQYHHQIERFYQESIRETMADLFMPEENPPF